MKQINGNFGVSLKYYAGRDDEVWIDIMLECVYCSYACKQYKKRHWDCFGQTKTTVFNHWRLLNKLS